MAAHDWLSRSSKPITASRRTMGLKINGYALLEYIDIFDPIDAPTVETEQKSSTLQNSKLQYKDGNIIVWSNENILVIANFSPNPNPTPVGS